MLTLSIGIAKDVGYLFRRAAIAIKPGSTGHRARFVRLESSRSPPMSTIWMLLPIMLQSSILAFKTQVTAWFFTRVFLLFRSMLLALVASQVTFSVFPTIRIMTNFTEDVIS